MSCRLVSFLLSSHFLFYSPLLCTLLLSLGLLPSPLSSRYLFSSLLFSSELGNHHPYPNHNHHPYPCPKENVGCEGDKKRSEILPQPVNKRYGLMYPIPATVIPDAERTKSGEEALRRTDMERKEIRRKIALSYTMRKRFHHTLEKKSRTFEGTKVSRCRQQKWRGELARVKKNSHKKGVEIREESLERRM
jgi:hypothetical protein